MYATKAEKTQVPLSMPWLKISSSMKSVLSRGSRAARGVWRRNVTRYLVGPTKNRPQMGRERTDLHSAIRLRLSLVLFVPAPATVTIFLWISEPSS